MKFLLKLEKFIGSVKFAVIIILLFALALTGGTFVESWYNTEYANRLVYKSLPFMLLQFAMFLSIFVATALRFPYKKRLFGFYILHLGLLLIFAGSVVTYIVGIDGSMQLLPNTPTRDVQISNHILEIIDTQKQKSYVLNLPYAARVQQLDKKFQGLNFKEYYPFAKLKRHWLPSHTKLTRSSHYLLKNENFTQDFLLSSHPDSDEKSTMTLGLLNIHYLPKALSPCFEKGSYILWDTKLNQCYEVTAANSQKEKNLLIVKTQGQTYSFKPEISPLPLVPNTQTMDASSSMRIFSKKLFEEKPHLFAFGDQIAFFDDQWVVKKIPPKGVELPWMGFNIRLIKDSSTTYPKKVPSYLPPKGDKPRVQAIKVNFNGEDFWLTSGKTMQAGPYQLRIKADSIKLPFHINLEKFTMGLNPGTNSPASYQSTVTVFDGETSRVQKVFMNNPINEDQFTFYQASYFPLGKNQYGSVLSVNYDPGRFLKYLGSLLLVLGSFWHFYLRKLRWFKK